MYVYECDLYRATFSAIVRLHLPAELQDVRDDAERYAYNYMGKGSRISRPRYCGGRSPIKCRRPAQLGKTIRTFVHLHRHRR